MSQENVEIVRGLAAAFNDGSIEAMRPLLDPELVWHEDPSFPEAGDNVVVNILIHGRGTASGAGFDLSAWWAFTLRDGKVVRCFSYLDRDAALEAVGLSELAMSQENIEIVRQVLNHWNDTGELLWELLDPEYEHVIDPPAWLAGTYRGHAELSDLIRRVAEVFEEFRFEGDELVPAGDRVVSLGGIRVRGALSGPGAVQTGGAGVHELRDGRIVRTRIYFDREQALRDAGLRE